MKRWLVGLAAVALVVGGGWFWVSPILAMHALIVSARAGDRDALADEVDFSAVRESLKSQMKAAMVGKLAGDKAESGGFAALGALFAMTLADTAIDAVVSPDGIKSLVAAGKLQDPGRPPDPGTDPTPRWVIERRGIDRFLARPVAKDNDRPPTLVFKRVGLSWRLIDIVLPVDGTN